MHSHRRGARADITAFNDIVSIVQADTYLK